MTNEDSKSRANASTTLRKIPAEIEKLGLTRWFEKMTNAGHTAYIKTNLDVEDWALTTPGFEGLEYEWQGDKTYPAAVGYPFTSISTERVFDPATNSMQVSVRHDLSVPFSFEGKPVVVLGYDELTHCMIVLRGDVYER